MRAYDSNKPLIFCHIPRTGGLAMWRWLCEMVGRRAVSRGDNYRLRNGQVCRAHFNAWGKRSPTNLQPHVSQFMTILRDPFDHLVSWYFYVKYRWCGNVSGSGGTVHLADYDGLGGFLRDYTYDTTRFLPLRSPYVRPLPEMLDDFVFVAVTERMHACLSYLAYILHKPVPRFRHGNPGGSRDEPVTNRMRIDFKRKHKEDYAIYRYALARWTPIWRQAVAGRRKSAR